MNLLLDTHIALWAITDSQKLTPSAKALILNTKNTVWVSVASLWEIAIKHALARGNMPVSAQEALRYFQLSGYQLLTVQAEHTIMVEQLPHHHQDPFDRLLVAQALAEPMRLLTHDALVAKYSDLIMLV